MKRIATFIAAALAGMTMTAQTLNVEVGQVTYQIPAADAGEMVYQNGETLTILDKVYTLSDISQMYIDDAEVSEASVSVAYSDDEAKVTVDGRIAKDLTFSINGAHVIVVPGSDVDYEITYSLSGTSADGEFTLGGSYKSTVELNGLTLTNPNGAAINITNGKRIALSVKKDTENTLTDGTGGSQKAALYCKGHLELKGKGTLNVYGNTAHGIKSGDYTSMKNCTVNILKAVKDGLSVNEYFLMESGTLTISGTGDDGIQCDLGGTASTGETTDHDDEDTGNIYIEGGSLTVNVTAETSKDIKADGDLRISDGTLNIVSSGGAAWDSDDSEVKSSHCLSSDGNMAISGGTLTLKATGKGGKCIKSDGTLTISGGTLSATTTGSKYTYSRDSASPKAIKSTGAMTISGGTIYAKSGNHEAIESKSTLTISGGYVYAEATETSDHPRLPFAEVRISDEQGQLVAVLTSSGYRKQGANIDATL